MKTRLTLTRFLGRLRGASQPILAETSDRKVMVVKFGAGTDGPNLLFNEAMGSELYLAAGLTVPQWALVLATEDFLEAHPECWPVEQGVLVPPPPGPVFASHYIHAGNLRVTQVLAGSSLSRVERGEEFWLAWLLDVCAQHADHRQALFVEQPSRLLRPVFIDHGQMFGGAGGELDPRFRASRFLDSRLYPEPTEEMKERILQRVEVMDCDKLLRLANRLPEEWITSLAVSRFAACLGRLAKRSLLSNMLDTLFATCEREQPVDALACRFPVQSESGAMDRTRAASTTQSIRLQSALLGSRFA